jgi:uncharacterized cupredoxin-like copper-binding protein
MSKRFGFTAVAMLALTATFAPAFAAQMKPAVIKVSLGGEAGQPMYVKLDQATGKAGSYEFDVTNDAIGTDHEVVLVKLAKADEVIKADTKKHRVNEKKLRSLGEVAGLKPGKSGKLLADLKPGEYVLLCNHKSHYELGMATHFTVTN